MRGRHVARARRPGRLRRVRAPGAALGRLDRVRGDPAGERARARVGGDPDAVPSRARLRPGARALRRRGDAAERAGLAGDLARRRARDRGRLRAVGGARAAGARRRAAAGRRRREHARRPAARPGRPRRAADDGDQRVLRREPAHGLLAGRARVPLGARAAAVPADLLRAGGAVGAGRDRRAGRGGVPRALRRAARAAVAGLPRARAAARRRARAVPRRAALLHALRRGLHRAAAGAGPPRRVALAERAPRVLDVGVGGRAAGGDRARRVPRAAAPSRPWRPSAPTGWRGSAGRRP